MAGAFGYGRGDPYDVSVGCAERVLLPEVRKAAEDEIIIANGFSCRGQIEQGTGRKALHLAQVLELALQEGESGPRERRPEIRFERRRHSDQRKAAFKAAAIASGLACAGWVVWRFGPQNHSAARQHGRQLADFLK